MGSMSLRTSLFADIQGLSNSINAAILLRPDRALLLEQEISNIATEIEHNLATPIGMIQLPIKIRKVAWISLLQTLRSLFRRIAPQMILFQLSPPSRNHAFDTVH